MTPKFRWLMKKARMRRILLLFALPILLLIVALLWPLSSSRPSISISSIRYDKIVKSADPSRIRATFGLTNSGSVAFSVVPLQQYVIRIEANDKSVRTEDHRAETAFIRTKMSPWGESILHPTEGITTWIDLPADTNRWQIGYSVSVASAQSNFEARFGAKWTKPIVRLFGRLLPNEHKVADVWGPMIEAPDLLDARDQ